MQNIRKATKQDVPKMVEIHKNCISKTNAEFYDKKVIDNWLNLITEENILIQFENTTWIVIRENNTIAGFAQYALEDNELYQIQIDPSFQGRNFGKELFNYIENEFIKNNKDKVSLNATLNAVPFYKNLGFVELENISYGDIDMIKMEKVLNKN